MCVYSHARVCVVERACIFAFGERRRRRPKIFKLFFTNTSLCFSAWRPNQYSAVIAKGSIGNMAERPKPVAHSAETWVRTPVLVVSVRCRQFVFGFYGRYVCSLAAQSVRLCCVLRACTLGVYP